MLRILVLLLILIPTTFVWSDNILVIGVVEEQSSYNRKPVVRALFKKDDKSWTVLNSKEVYSKASLPNILKWNLVFDGRNLGDIISSDSSRDTR